MEERTYGDDIPTYSKEDKERLFAERANDQITPNLKFGDLVRNKVSSALVPLQEYVFRQWYYKRIITIGDAAHKVPIHIPYCRQKRLTMGRSTQSLATAVTHV